MKPLDYKSRYAVNSDCYDQLDMYTIPDEWWSRKAEYPWAAQFVTAGHTLKVADLACGVPHFFKHYLAHYADMVYAVDCDFKLADVIVDSRHLKCIVSDLWHVPQIANSSLDVTYCISVLEHLTPDGRLLSLEEMKRMLKPYGLAVCTFDVPVVTPEEFGRLATKAGLVWAGPVDMTRPEDALHSDKFKLDVFMAVLRKPDW